MREPVILWEGSCAYAVRQRDDRYEIRVFSSNSVTHVVAGEVATGDRAESICRRLNAYPSNTRRFHGLL